MLNYENRLVIVTYCIKFEGLIQLDAESPIINKEISVAQAALVFTVFAHNEKKFRRQTTFPIYVQIGETLNTY